jgi:hypothetical protein
VKHAEGLLVSLIRTIPIEGCAGYLCQMGTPEGVRRQIMEDTIEALRSAAEFTEHAPGLTSHTLITVGGLEAPEAIAALGTFLTGLIAGAVTIDMRVIELLLGSGPEYAEELDRELTAVLGADNDSITPSFREDRRDPWIGECLAHALLVIHRGEPGLCVPALVRAVTLPHDKPSQQGLDLVAIYEEDGGPGLCVGESKASENWAGQHLSRSVGLFREIDESKRNYQIRSVVLNTLFANVNPELQGKMEHLFWEDRRLYLPLIGYSAASDFNPASERPQTLGVLSVPQNRRRLVVIPLESYPSFFDGVADAMRAAVERFV